MSDLHTFSKIFASNNSGHAASTEYHVVKRFLAALLAAACVFGASAQTVVPTFTMTAPAAGASFIGPAQVVLRAAAFNMGEVKGVFFYNGETQLHYDDTAPYNFAWYSVPAGTYSITSKAINYYGGVAISAPLLVTVIPNVKPAVTLTAPVAGGDYIAPVTIALAAIPTDTDGEKFMVSWYRDGTLIGTKWEAPYIYEWRNAPAGTYRVTAIAMDEKGDTATSDAVTVIVKANQLPTVAIIAPANNTVGNHRGVFHFQAAASDNDGTITSVSYYAGERPLGSSTVAPYAVDYSELNFGNHEITAKATDDKGGVQISAPLIVTVKLNDAPFVALTSPTNNASFVAPGAITLNASAIDSDGSIRKVDFYNGTTLLASDTLAPFSYTWSGVTIGTYNLTAKATDEEGVATTSASVIVTVAANVPPTVGLTSPVSNSTFYGPATMQLAANASDSDGVVTKVAYFQGATLIGDSDIAPYTFAWSNPPFGTHDITAQATDDKGLTTISAAAAVTVKEMPVPSVSITAPGNDASFTAPATLTFTSEATVTGDTIRKVEYISGINMIGMASTPPYTVTLNNVVPGNYAVTAKATGVLGGSATSASVSVKVVGNSAPVVSLTANPTTAAAPAAITLTAVPTDSDGTIAKVEFYNGATLLDTVTQAPYTATWGNVAMGAYSLTAKAFDNLGASSTSAAQTVTVTVPATSQVFYIFSDQINTARQITNAAGAKVWQADPDPFGANPPNENPAGQGQFTYNQRFPGQYFDKETGLHYNYYRDYDPQTGRYMQSDPIGLRGGINTYAYVGGDPIGSTDHRGLSSANHKDRPMDPNGDGCRNLRKRIENLKIEIARQIKNLAENPQGLPEFCPPGGSMKDSRQGHRDLLEKYKKDLKNNEDSHRDRCEGGGGDDPSGNAPVTNLPDESGTSKAKASSPPFWLIFAIPIGGALLSQ